MIDAVIFDCDGVLVDSEELAMDVWVEMAAEYGFTLSHADALAAFRGGEMAKCVAHLESLIGRSVRDDFVPDFRARSAEKFERELKPIPGVIEVLNHLPVPFCVASNGPLEKMDVSLRVCGLDGYFIDRVISAYRVGSFKPAPGLFLAAAARLGANPARCAVVEDSMTGARAGIAAGMSVFTICAASEADAFRSIGTTPFQTMDELIGLLGFSA
ncbi:MAG: HAD family hydrolase [Pseudomonadota bacterium]